MYTGKHDAQDVEVKDRNLLQGENPTVNDLIKALSKVENPNKAKVDIKSLVLKVDGDLLVDY